MGQVDVSLATAYRVLYISCNLTPAFETEFERLAQKNLSSKSFKTLKAYREVLPQGSAFAKVVIALLVKKAVSAKQMAEMQSWADVRDEQRKALVAKIEKMTQNCTNK